VSINDQVKEEMQRQIEIAIEEIPYKKKRWSKSTAKLRLQYKNISDFLLGFESGRISEDGFWFYRKSEFSFLLHLYFSLFVKIVFSAFIGTEV
jgi:hypothetical protein